MDLFLVEHRDDHRHNGESGALSDVDLHNTCDYVIILKDHGT